MMNKKRVYPLLAALLLILSVPTAVYGEGKVSYQGNAEKFVFSPGTEYSPTDLFTDFKDVMPGDSITQKIVIKNDAPKGVKAKIYLRSLGSKDGSQEYLSKLKLKVVKEKDAVLFDAAAGEKSQLSEWVLLGTLYSGGQAELNLSLDVPIELGDDFQNAVGYLDWQFKAEEFPVEPEDPDDPETGDSTSVLPYIGAFLVSAGVAIGVAIDLRRKKYKTEV